MGFLDVPDEDLAACTILAREVAARAKDRLVFCLNGNKSQGARTRALEGFRRGEPPVLVAFHREGDDHTGNDHASGEATDAAEDEPGTLDEFDKLKTEGPDAGQ